MLCLGPGQAHSAAECPVLLRPPTLRFSRFPLQPLRLSHVFRREASLLSSAYPNPQPESRNFIISLTLVFTCSDTGRLLPGLSGSCHPLLSHERVYSSPIYIQTLVRDLSQVTRGLQPSTKVPPSSAFAIHPPFRLPTTTSVP